MTFFKSQSRKYDGLWGKPRGIQETVVYICDNSKVNTQSWLVLKKLVPGGEVGGRWNPVIYRIMSARFNALTIIIPCALNYEAEENSKDKFYEQLQREVERAPRHNMRIITRDMNAREG